MATETYPKPGQQKRVPPVRPTSEFESPEIVNARTIDEATSWTVCHHLGDGQKWTMTTDNLEWAFAMGRILATNNQRVTLTAVHPRGQAAIIPQMDWANQFSRWQRRGVHVVPKHKTRESEGPGVHGTDKRGREGGEGKGERVRPARKQGRPMADGVERRGVPDGGPELKSALDRIDAAQRTRPTKQRESARKKK